MSNKEVLSAEQSDEVVSRFDELFLFTSFNELVNNLTAETKKVLSSQAVKEEEIVLLLASLNTLWALCRVLLKQYTLEDNDVRELMDIQQFALYSMTSLLRHIHKEPVRSWSKDQYKFTTTNKQLALEWVKKGIASSVSEVYMPLSEEQQDYLNKKRDEWRKQMSGVERSNIWSSQSP